MMAVVVVDPSTRVRGLVAPDVSFIPETAREPSNGTVALLIPRSGWSPIGCVPPRSNRRGGSGGRSYVPGSRLGASLLVALSGSGGGRGSWRFYFLWFILGGKVQAGAAGWLGKRAASSLETLDV